MHAHTDNITSSRAPVGAKINDNGQFSMFTFDYMNTVEVQKMNNLEFNQTFL